MIKTGLPDSEFRALIIAETIQIKIGWKNDRAFTLLFLQKGRFLKFFHSRYVIANLVKLKTI